MADDVAREPALAGGRVVPGVGRHLPDATGEARSDLAVPIGDLAQLSPPKMPETDSSSKTARIASAMICPTETTASFGKPFSGGIGSEFVTMTRLSGEF